MTKKITRKDLFENGLIEQGQFCQIINQPETVALIVSENIVQYQGQNMSFNSWLKQVTGWGGVSLFQKCEIVGIGTLENVRRQYLGLPPVFKNHHKKRRIKT